jgi:hypothetical protein
VKEKDNVDICDETCRRLLSLGKLTENIENHWKI